MTGRCATCRWWKPFGPPASLVAPEVELGDCDLFETCEGAKVHSHAQLIVTRTGSGEATVATYAEFGCVQWEAR